MAEAKCKESGGPVAERKCGVVRPEPPPRDEDVAERDAAKRRMEATDAVDVARADDLGLT